MDIVFPPENRALFSRIAEKGAVLSQFPFGRRGDKQSFAIRNRIVAGLTLGTVVVEANHGSGALITSDFAAEYGRQVFAVPGRVDAPRSRGCHDLIKHGAKLCESAEDILSEFEYLFPPSRPSAASFDSDSGPGADARPGLPAMELSSHERQVWDALPRGDTVHVDEVIRHSGLPSSAVSVALLSLEMKHLVRQRPGRRFERSELG
jgi:DNA processing protein